MKTWLVLFLIILLGFLMRFYLLGKNPPSINTDEAAIGYNAYSILKTGRDEYGKFLPYEFRSFDDYKPPLYIYLTVPSVALFGLTEYAVRFPGAVMGVLAVAFFYLLLNRVFHRPRIALFGSLFLAISPWHLIYSRTAFESGALVLFTAAGSYFFFKGQDRKIYFLISAVIFGLSPFLYQSAKAFSPLLVGIMLALFVWWPQTSLKSKILITCLFALTLFPGFLTLISPQGSLRFRGMSIFGDQRVDNAVVELRRVDWLRNDNRSAQLFHPLPLAHLNDLFISYLSYYRPDFLFLDNTDTRLGYVPNNGLLFLFELPFLLFGLYYLFHSLPLRHRLYIGSWLLIAPIAGSVVLGAPNSIRSTTMIMPLNLLAAIGLVCFIKKILPIRLLAFFIAVFGVIVVYSVAYYEHFMFIHAPIQNSQQWYYGYKQVVEEAQRLAPKYDHIVVSNSLDEPYIFFLFYTRKDPASYQRSGGTVSGAFWSDLNKFDKYSFVFLNWDQIRHDSHILAIGAPKDFTPDFPLNEKFSYLDGQPSVYVVGNN